MEPNKELNTSSVKKNSNNSILGSKKKSIGIVTAAERKERNHGQLYG